VRIERIDATLKLSQNRPEADIDGVVTGLQSVGDAAGAEAVATHRP
jgi:transcriptional regulator